VNPWTRLGGHALERDTRNRILPPAPCTNAWPSGLMSFLPPSSHSGPERPPSRMHHRAAQFMQQCPGRLVALQPQHPLQTHGADSVLLVRYVPSGRKPESQRQVAVLKDGPGGHRNLVAASRTSPKKIGFRPTLSSTAEGDSTSPQASGDKTGTPGNVPRSKIGPPTLSDRGDDLPCARTL
jgi:hypothetical protein